ncbi:MAG: hypothetical protein AAF378_17260 [Cyanobacteria bacterium P01_A01_bin.84]
MTEFWQNLFFSRQYHPQGSSYLWQSELVGLHFISDLLIGIGYYLISLILFYITRKNRNLPFNDILILFALLMLGCGSIHLLSVWTLWYPAYWVSGWLKAGVALTFMHTVLVMVESIPKVVGKSSKGKNFKGVDTQNSASLQESEETKKI